MQFWRVLLCKLDIYLPALRIKPSRASYKFLCAILLSDRPRSVKLIHDCDGEAGKASISMMLGGDVGNRSCVKYLSARTSYMLASSTQISVSMTTGSYSSRNKIAFAYSSAAHPMVRVVSSDHPATSPDRMQQYGGGPLSNKTNLYRRVWWSQ